MGIQKDPDAWSAGGATYAVATSGLVGSVEWAGGVAVLRSGLLRGGGRVYQLGGWNEGWGLGEELFDSRREEGCGTNSRF